MVLRIGTFVWIPCEVRPGPFDDERLARITDAEVEWVGFVSTDALQSPVVEGRTAVTALILNVSGNRYLALPIGRGVDSPTFRASVETLSPVGPVAA